MSTPTPETVQLVQKYFVLILGRPADTSLAPNLEQQITDGGGPGALDATLNEFLTGQAAAIGGQALVMRMAEQGLGLTLSSADAAVLASSVSSGFLTWAQLVSIVVSLEGDLGDTLTNRAAAAQAFTDALTSQDKGAQYSGATLFDAAHDLLAGVTSDASTVALASQSLQALVDHLGPDGLSLPAADGYLANATVFVDSDGDGQLDAGEFSTSADASGNFDIPASAGAGDLVAFGGTDLLTGQPFAGYMSAPSGATVINPLTTLVKGVLDGGFAASAQAAADIVVSALGLPAGINLLTYDPMAVFANGSATPEELAQALAVEAKALEVINLITQAATAIDAATPLDLAQSANLVIDALAAAAAGGGPLDLTDADTLAGIIGDAVSDLLGGAALSDGLLAVIGQVAQITAASNQAADDAGTLHDLAQVANVAQGDVVDALHDAFTGAASLPDVVDAFTGENLQDAIDGAPVGEIVPGMPVPGDDAVNAAPTAVALLNALVAIAEDTDTATHIKVADISITDDGLGANSITLTGANADMFEVVGTELFLKAGVELDFETQDDLAVTVNVVDHTVSGSEPVTVSYTLNVSDVDEEVADVVPPVITSGATAAAIDENSGATQAVYTVTATDAGGGLTYSLAAGGDAASFGINATTGVVTLTGNPDFEAKSSYSFTVVATDAAGNASQQAVSLAINNLDDAAPTITSGATAAAIDENSGAGQVVYTVTSTDTGDISTGSTTYSLKPATGDGASFTINASTGAVTLTANPDQETKASYSFTVVATDAAGNASEKAVTLAINDLDEAPPTITSGATATAIDENSGAGQVVYTVTSTDTGDVSTGSTTYSLKPATGDGASFTINGSTGAVTLTANPDQETKANYGFTVVATDAAGNFSEKAVTLAINDVDDSAPTITSGDTADAIDENSGAGQLVYTVTSTDTGDVSTGSTTYSLKATGDAADFSIDGSTGAVTLTGNPDQETKASYSFTVVATDAAGNASEQAVTLAINDLDDTAPTITSGDTADAIDENSGAGQVVYTVTSTDTDDVSTGSTTYSLKALTGDVADFSIDGSTGAVTLTGDPDQETKASYSFTVVATDAAGNASEQAVTLAINDLDEVAPTITSGDTAAAIDENSGAGQVVYTATSTDTDDISTGSTTYSLKPLTGDVDDFSIDGGTGAVTLTGNPDHETKASYTFTVVATDAAGNASEQAVTLAINDLDEIAPTITSGDTADAIDENIGAGQVVYTVTSTDTDDISTGSTHYSLKVVDDGASFSIDPDSGAVTLIGDPDFETKPSYSFTVVATDAAGNASEQAVTLAINNLDEVAPTVTSGDTADAIDENSGAGQEVYTAAADDTGDVSDGVTFSLAEVDDFAAFTIDGSTGKVTLTGNPNFEVKSSYSFTVIATDGAGLTGEQAVTLAINDVNDAPTLTAGTQSAQLVEAGGVDNATLGTAAATIELTKDDEDGTASFDEVWLAGPGGWATADAGLTYTKTGTYGTATLTIATGVVSYALDDDDADTQGLADAAAVSDDFTVQVTDGMLTGSTVASFSITGSNDTPTITAGPVFSSTAVTFTAVDVDAGATLNFSGAFSGAVNNGTTTTLTPSEQPSAVLAGPLTVSDGLASTTFAYVGFGTAGANSITVSGSNVAGLYGFAGNDSLTGGTAADFIVGGLGADTLTGGTGVDTFVAAAGDTALTITGSNKNGVITGYDVIADFALGVGGDKMDTVGTATIVANGAVDGANSALKLDGPNNIIQSHSVTDGIVTFDNAATFAAAEALTTTGDVATAVQYLQANDLGNAGATVAFTATIGGTAHTYLFTQGNDAGTNNLDVLVDLVGVTATSVNLTEVAGGILVL